MSTALRRVIVGTAGHIDHGKTRLLLALTGIDCDRWEEEKRRGITIDLGFAHLREGDLQIGFVDVPGHERFLHNALAGLGGIRIALLVVSADQGVEPQTREHLAICSLLGIETLVAVVTKRDLVDADVLELALMEVEELLEAHGYANAPVLAVSSTTGEGLDELRNRLLDLARSRALASDDESGNAFRLPIDRAFHLQGRGVVVTGSPASGRVAAGDELEVLPGGSRTRVRSLQVHAEDRESAGVGERTALRLGGVELDDVERGRQLVTPGLFAPSRTLAARVRILDDVPKAVEGWTPVRLHLFASEEVGRFRPLVPPRLEPGEEGVVEVRVARPIVAIRGDRVVFRVPSPQRTLGGGEVLDPDWRRRRGASLARAVTALGELDTVLRLWVAEARERGTTASALAPRLGVPAARLDEHLDRLVAGGHLLSVGEPPQRRVLVADAVQRVLSRAKRVLAAHFEADRLSPGLSRAELLGRVLPRSARSIDATWLEWMVAAKVLSVREDLVTLPGRRVELTTEESRLSRNLMEAMEAAGATPPSPGELADRISASRPILEGVQRYLVDSGRLVRLPGGLLVSSKAVDDLRAALEGTEWDRFSVPEFKDRFGLSRKWAIPWLEHLDSIGATRRIGDERQVVRRG